MTDIQTDVPSNPAVPRSITREMHESYLTYALSVIHSRALPDARDGLKPSQRRILVAMNDLKLGPRAKYRKCAKIAGDTSGNYHPHGESVIYPTLVRMAQDFSLRYPLVDGQGNFGSIDADPPAAMRYTEARMTGMSTELMRDLEKDTVEFEPNYDETRTQPTVLPSRFPNLLCNGSDGIAVGMATSMPPHNLNEICRASLAILEDPAISIKELMDIVPGPDFPTGGIIMGRMGIHSAYTTGRGRIRVRARYHVDESGKRQRLVFTEIPYQTRKAADKTGIIAKIVDVVKDERITGIYNVEDQSSKDGMWLVVELKKGEDPEVVANQLFKYTPLQTTYSIINLAIHERQPRTLNLRQLIDAYLEHRRDVIRRRTEFLLAKAEDRKHIVDGLLIATDNIDRVIEIIRASADREEAKSALCAEYKLSERQSQAIVDMRLGSLTGLERDKLVAEHEALVAEITDLKDILARASRVTAIIREDLEELMENYGDDRRTEISSEEVDTNFDIADLITEDLMAVTFSRNGYVKRLTLDTYRAQARGGVGVKGQASNEDDVLQSLFVASTHDYILCFTNMGQVFWLKVYNIPEATRASKGRSITNLLSLRAGETISSLLRVPEFDEESFVVFATRKGVVKKTPLSNYSRPKKGGIIAIRLEEGDAVVGVNLCRKGDTILMASSSGRAIRFDEESARSMGRTARGVKGLKLKGDDAVVGMIVAEEGADLLTVCRHGHGKRTPLAEYPIKGRGGQGVINIRTTERNGEVVAVRQCRQEDDAMFITEAGMIVRSHVNAISSIGRNTQGVRIVNLRKEDSLVGAEVVSEADLERFADEESTDTGEAQDSSSKEAIIQSGEGSEPEGGAVAEGGDVGTEEATDGEEG